MSEQENLKNLVLETANCSIAVSVNEEGWFTTLGNTKERFSNPDFDGLCKDLSSYISEKRTAKTPSVRSPKTFTL